MLTKFALSIVPYLITNPAVAVPVLVVAGVAVAISDAAKKN